MTVKNFCYLYTVENKNSGKILKIIKTKLVKYLK